MHGTCMAYAVEQGEKMGQGKRKMSKEDKERLAERLAKRSKPKPSAYFNDIDGKSDGDETTFTGSEEVDLTDYRSKLDSKNEDSHVMTITVTVTVMKMMMMRIKSWIQLDIRHGVMGNCNSSFLLGLCVVNVKMAMSH